MRKDRLGTIKHKRPTLIEGLILFRRNVESYKGMGTKKYDVSQRVGTAAPAITIIRLMTTCSFVILTLVPLAQDFGKLPQAILLLETIQKSERCAWTEKGFLNTLVQVKLCVQSVLGVDKEQVLAIGQTEVAYQLLGHFRLTDRHHDELHAVGQDLASAFVVLQNELLAQGSPERPHKDHNRRWG